MRKIEVIIMYTGRREIWTDEREITRNNILTVLENAYPTFCSNRSDCDYLLEYDKGNQPIQREKKYRSDINIETIDNVANEITNFKVGFHFGNEITLVQRGHKDVGEKNSDENKGIAELNECFASEYGKAKTQELGRFVEICGVGYTFVDVNTEYEEGDSYFKYVVLDPRYAFVVRSTAYIDRRIVLGVTYRQDEKGNSYFTCFTPHYRFEVVGGRIQNGNEEQLAYNHGNRSGEINPLGRIPIIEWRRSPDKTGVWERQISDMDSLNIMESDASCLLDQNVQAVWHANDVEFAKDQNGNIVTPQSNDWIMTQTTRDGKTPFVKPLSQTGDFGGILNNITFKRTMILQKCNVPQRNDNSGGSTGVAMSDATGWSQAEVEAQKQQSIMEGAKMEEVKVALSAIRISPDVPSDSPLLKLKYSDVTPSIKRQKNYEMATKVNALAALISHGINGLHSIRVINLFDDAQQVYEDSKDLIDKYQKSLFERNTTVKVQERAAADESDQVTNSPMIDGMSKEDPTEDTEDG